MMDYFAISQDTALFNLVLFDHNFIPEMWKREIKIRRSVEFEYGKLPQGNHNFLVKSNKDNIYPDLIETPIPLLSTRLKEVFCSYENQIECSCAILSDNVLRRQEVYWLFALERVPCLSKDAEFYPNGFLKKLVLNKNFIKDHTVFRIQGIMERQIVIRFDVLESILRRPIAGIQIEKIDCQ